MAGSYFNNQDCVKNEIVCLSNHYLIQKNIYQQTYTEDIYKYLYQSETDKRDYRLINYHFVKTPECNICPENGISDNGTDSINKCYKSPNSTFSNSKGSGIINGKCFYKE